MSWEARAVHQATSRLRLEIRQLSHELELARAAGNRAEEKRIREKLEPLNDALRNWLQLINVSEGVRADEEL